MDENTEVKSGRMDTTQECPRCGNTYIGFPAFSRRDNQTHICPTCGLEEAIVDMLKNNGDTVPEFLAKREKRLNDYIAAYERAELEAHKKMKEYYEE